MLADGRDVAAQRQHLVAGRHDVVGGDVVTHLDDHLGLEVFGQRVEIGKRHDIRAGDDLHCAASSGGSGKMMLESSSRYCSGFCTPGQGMQFPQVARIGDHTASPDAAAVSGEQR